jgi:hypothetical protein
LISNKKKDFSSNLFLCTLSERHIGAIVMS